MTASGAADSSRIPAETRLQWRGRSGSVEQTMAVGAAVGALARAGDLIALYGELGAGKTQFVKGLAEAMGVGRAHVCSPTFVMVQEHEPPGGGSALVHVDAYRVQGRHDLESIGWDSPGERGLQGGEAPAVPRGKSPGELSGKLPGVPGDLFAGAVVVVEWADRLAGHLGGNRLDVTLAHRSEHERDIVIVPHGAWTLRMRELSERLDRIESSTSGHKPEPSP